ncbi:MAG TPA: hypothetical protein VFH61_12935 [Thermoleophilia bacterium]|nr:hypothetical protein [Thermoleophilia bacterium]
MSHLVQSLALVLGCAALGYSALLGSVQLAMCGLLLVIVAMVEAFTLRSLLASLARSNAAAMTYRDALDDANERLRLSAEANAAMRDRLAQATGRDRR